MAGWLSWKCAVSPVTAREQVRVARCLRCLPGLAERFGSGRLSYSQVRAITRAATPESVEVLAGMAGFAPQRSWRRSLGRGVGPARPRRTLRGAARPAGF